MQDDLCLSFKGAWSAVVRQLRTSRALSAVRAPRSPAVGCSVLGVLSSASNEYLSGILLFVENVDSMTEAFEDGLSACQEVFARGASASLSWHSEGVVLLVLNDAGAVTLFVGGVAS